MFLIYLACVVLGVMGIMLYTPLSVILGLYSIVAMVILFYVSVSLGKSNQ